MGIVQEVLNEMNEHLTAFQLCLPAQWNLLIMQSYTILSVIIW